MTEVMAAKVTRGCNCRYIEGRKKVVVLHTVVRLNSGDAIEVTGECVGVGEDNGTDK